MGHDLASTEHTQAPAVVRGDYGYDAPYALVALWAISVACLAVALWGWCTGHGGSVAAGLIYGAVFGLNAASYHYTTRRGKLQAWGQILNDLVLSGGERVLDLGCGRGAVLHAAARRLTTGHAIGIDLWSASDQSGNAPRTTLANADKEGVRGRVRIATGDMRALPFADASFDLIVSSLAIHNIPSRAERALAVAEAYRVLAPGGRLAIADVRSTGLYAKTLARLGGSEVRRRPLGWRFMFGNPLGIAKLVSACKR